MAAPRLVHALVRLAPFGLHLGARRGQWASLVARAAGLVGCPKVVQWAASRLGRTFSEQAAGGHAGP